MNPDVPRFARVSTARIEYGSSRVRLEVGDGRLKNSWQPVVEPVADVAVGDGGRPSGSGRSPVGRGAMPLSVEAVSWNCARAMATGTSRSDSLCR